MYNRVSRQKGANNAFCLEIFSVGESDIDLPTTSWSLGAGVELVGIGDWIGVDCNLLTSDIHCLYDIRVCDNIREVKMSNNKVRLVSQEIAGVVWTGDNYREIDEFVKGIDIFFDSKSLYILNGVEVIPVQIGDIVVLVDGFVELVREHELDSKYTIIGS